jgi:uncharacterized protein (DUF302 family)
MTDLPDMIPFGTKAIDGVGHRRSPLPITETVERLSVAIGEAGAKVFAVIDQAGEAQAVGLSLRPTYLLIFGNPIAGTPVMESSPVAALDLPLKILVWADDSGHVWMTYVSADWLAQRYDLSEDVARRLSAPEALASRMSAPL